MCACIHTIRARTHTIGLYFSCSGKAEVISYHIDSCQTFITEITNKTEQVN